MPWVSRTSEVLSTTVALDSLDALHIFSCFACSVVSWHEEIMWQGLNWIPIGSWTVLGKGTAEEPAARGVV